MNDNLFPDNVFFDAARAPFSAAGAEAFSQMDSYGEWELEQDRHAKSLNAGSPELAQRFELDIHDCWVSEIK
ncbi:hypothetical protein ACFSFZ_10435 [Mixta tenebrionis]|uniref:Uncharacterized protein n=1 Tax=Mixta tenebrionis TaxID=2562439 RepID=A0A506UZ74_9GAMM|nr:hypothetical protein [Mixta tenebrionis]TPW38711.1 hypothetical protein FKM52_20335 [Mixta tenebrionis]